MMGKRVKWKTDATAYGKIVYRTWGENIGWSFANTFLCILFVWATFVIGSDVFLFFNIDEKYIGELFFWIFLSNIVNEFLSATKYRFARHIGNLAGLIFMALWAWKFMDTYAREWNLGAEYVIQKYVEKLNYYNGWTLVVEEGASRYVELFIGNTMLALVWLVQFCVVETRRNILFTILPVAVLGAELAVGESPGYFGLCLLTVAILLAISRNWFQKKSFENVVGIFGMTVVTLLVAFAMFHGPAENLAGHKKEVIAKVKQIENKLEGIFYGSTNVENGAVGNTFPNYQYKEVMQISYGAYGESKPTMRTYLRGDYGYEYADRKWSRRESIDEYEQSGIGFRTPLEWATQGYAFANERSLLFSYELGAKFSKTCKIEYTNLKSDYVYAPSLMGNNLDSDNAYQAYDFQIEEDFVVKWKDGSKDEERFTYLEPNIWEIVFEHEAMLEDLNPQEMLYKKQVIPRYLTVPEEQVTAKKIAKELQSVGGDRSAYYPFLAAKQVATYLSENYKYSKELGSSGATDPVEYFLGTSKEGFCVHFASAGVFILREMGVPARYVTGYAVDTDAIKPYKGVYSGKVLDSDAHAWVEIYVNNIGWTPVEMTAGYWQPEKLHVSDLVKKENSSSRTEIADSSETETQSETQIASETEDTQENETESAQISVENGASGEKSVIHWDKIIRVILWAVAASAMIGLILFIRKYRDSLWQAKRNREIKKGHYNKAACMMNRKIYMAIHRNMKLFFLSMNDAAYLKMLKESSGYVTEEEWDTYIAYVRKAAYSNEELTTDEFKTILDIYERTEKSEFFKRGKE